MKEYNSEITLRDILSKLLDYKSYLLKKKYVILSCTIIFFLFGLLLAITNDKRYHAELTFVVEDPQPGSALGAMSGIASQFGFDVGGNSSTTFSQENIIELLKSRGVVVAALMQKAKIEGKEDLVIEHYLKINNIKEDWKDNKFLPISYYDRLTYIHDSISGDIWTGIVDDNLVVGMQSDVSNIIRLSYFSVNEEFAKIFVEILIDEMIRMYVVHQTSQAKNTFDFLQNRADSVFNELEIVEEKYARIKDINRRIVKASGRLKELQLMRQVEVLNAMYLEIIKNLELSKITLLNKTPIINIIDKPILPLQEDRNSIAFLSIISSLIGFICSILFFTFRKIFIDALNE